MNRVNGGLSLEQLPDPTVGLIMGSDSDAKFVIPAEETLDYFGVPYETRVISAHRTPERMHDYAKAAAGRGLLAIIAFAGGSSHLQGMTASETVVPVLGVAIEGSADPLSASFGSQLRMPSDGGPLAVMGKNEAGSVNAALHVVRFLAISFPDLYQKLTERMNTKSTEVREKDERMRKLGAKAYVAAEKEAAKAREHAETAQGSAS